MILLMFLSAVITTLMVAGGGGGEGRLSKSSLYDAKTCIAQANSHMRQY